MYLGKGIGAGERSLRGSKDVPLSTVLCDTPLKVHQHLPDIDLFGTGPQGRLGPQETMQLTEILSTYLLRNTHYHYIQ